MAKNPSIVCAVSGVGASKAEKAAAGLVKKISPWALVSAGFCGALSDAPETGDLILDGDEELVQISRRAFPESSAGRIVSVDRVLMDADAKRRLNWESRAAAVDMESAAVANVAGRNGLLFLCVKAVLDTPAAPLACGYESVLKVLGGVLRRPSTLRGIRRDAARAKICADRLKDFFIKLAAAITPAP